MKNAAASVKPKLNPDSVDVKANVKFTSKSAASETAIEDKKVLDDLGPKGINDLFTGGKPRNISSMSTAKESLHRIKSEARPENRVESNKSSHEKKPIISSDSTANISRAKAKSFF